MRWMSVGWGLVLLLAACTGSHREAPGPGPVASDSETHFLTLCGSRCPDGLTCVCGACTRPCDDASACAEFGDVASCEPPRPLDRYSCGWLAPAAVCEAECSADADCAAVGAEHRCEQGVCRAPPRATVACPASPAPVCAEGEHLRAQVDGDGCTQAICEADLACSGPAEAGPLSCNASFQVYSFVAEHERCEQVVYGGCGATANNFETAEACWARCEADNPRADCFEAWEPVDGSDGVPVFGVDVAPLLARMQGTHRAVLRFPDRSETPLQAILSDVIAYRVRTTENTNPNRTSLGIPLPCRDSLKVEAAIEFATDDGSFDERWPRVPFEVTPDGRARAQLSLKRRGTPVNDYEHATLQGTYAPTLGPNTCDLGMTLTIAFGPATFSGEIDWIVGNAACENVVGTTAIGRVPSPLSPSWLAIDAAGNACEDDACCWLLSTDECETVTHCSPIEGSFYDVDRECTERRAAGCGPRERLCDDAETPARDAANQCWYFPNTCLPAYFVEATGCGGTAPPRIRVCE